MAAPSLDDLLTPDQVAVVTSECQRGVLGDPAIFPELAAVARERALPNIVTLVQAARSAGVPVVHTLAHRRVDGLGANHNARLFAAAAASPVRLDPDGLSGKLVEELDGDPRDLLSSRLHGVGPMAGTDLDPLLRNLEAATLVVVGVSINVAITNLVMDAVNLGYRVVLPRDAVVGVPVDYADAVIDNTLSLLATVSTTADVIATWGKRFVLTERQDG